MIEFVQAMNLNAWMLLSAILLCVIALFWIAFYVIPLLARECWRRFSKWLGIDGRPYF